MKGSFKALIAEKQGEDFSVQVKKLTVDQLPAGEVLIKVHYSGVNYKDSLATIPNGNVVKSYPIVPGIDLAGEVVSSEDERFKQGDHVIATSYEIGVSRHGGYSEYAKVPADYIVPLPAGMTTREAMIMGTAGFTAALSVQRLLENGLDKENGPVLVTGATGGVGSFAVAILSKLGFEVEASTGKQTEEDYLKELGADRIISRDEVYDGNLKQLASQRWAAAVDPVGGEPLASVLSQLKYNGSAAVSGLTAGGNVPTTVYPFILRGINLLGIDSVYCPKQTREKIWMQLATAFKPGDLERFVLEELTLDQLPEALPKLLEGNARGRYLVKISG
ncbi:putative quinone oxidoreductase, YhdH/YhfP family [Terribacillus halophilus]|uniref:Putative quinone oxidoreductase, YhdH/YhfP family n=1 Tax=Terribacillus halophilus TaxID=361279 RepID=A0A1G6WFD4_9BACI|nr:acryloyl-CoA reductase [Terribacillus halophilus]SDD63766.1 putative quinone oxidoreductase, YhdH/YhfP family [Terribacillus halophilus]